MARSRPVPIPRLLARGLVKHCPNCGAGHLFRRWFTMVEHCPGCDLPFDREPGWVLGAMTVNTAWTFLAILVTMAVGIVATYPDIASTQVTLAAAAAAVLTPVIGYPFSKTVWIAVDLAMVPARAAELRLEFQPLGEPDTRPDGGPTGPEDGDGRVRGSDDRGSTGGNGSGPSRA